jgi:hypothetical protein
MITKTIFKILTTTAIWLFVVLGTPAAFGATNEIMLEGFHWNSYNVPGGWYNIIKQNTARIKVLDLRLFGFRLRPSQQMTRVIYPTN